MFWRGWTFRFYLVARNFEQRLIDINEMTSSIEMTSFKCKLLNYTKVFDFPGWGVKTTRARETRAY